MREQLLYEAITHIDDDLIDAAGDYVPRKKASHSLKFWTAAMQTYNTLRHLYVLLVLKYLKILVSVDLEQIMGTFR